MSKYWSPLAASLVPYVPGEQPKNKKFIKLNTNENPYPPSPKALEAIREAANGDLRLYPDPTCDALIRKIADYYGVRPEQVFVGNGSDEVLAFSFAAFFNPAEPILFPDVTYSFYKVYAEFFGLKAELIPLNERFEVPFEQFERQNGGIVLPNPNAPTAILAPLDAFRGLLARNPDHVVLIDEAYIDFGGESAVKLVHEYPNALVVQTLSKSRSLAGMRVGFAVGSEELIEGLNRVKNSFNSYTLDRPALAAAIASFEDEAYFRQTVERVMLTREAVTDKLRQMGFHAADSGANFVFITHPKVAAKKLLDSLREQGILVRYFNQPRISNHLRVTIGTDEEMDAFIAALQTILAAEGC
ncbi:histidinol-phosphate transaminase [Paenibacillus protaetiae]|uniref:Histidinol-phosphate aminotransferase n=1 Tax=Paenibacillus protaetiae TaxID=2509456 RepID=A0A4P6FAY7_9BACL|nr:histidinol-phosphate transaminase [Paenibacillus protaetiae]QAY67678.1 histidinol-phosphate transaminase [Paenibacillus protaetiae]